MPPPEPLTTKGKLPTSQPDQLAITVVAAWPDRVWQKQVYVPAGSVIIDALHAAQVEQVFPDTGAAELPVGIYGQQRSAQHPLAHGDRIEIYRPLVFDPMESRRRRARHRQNKRG